MHSSPFLYKLYKARRYRFDTFWTAVSDTLLFSNAYNVWRHKQIFHKVTSSFFIVCGPITVLCAGEYYFRLWVEYSKTVLIFKQQLTSVVVFVFAKHDV